MTSTAVVSESERRWIYTPSSSQ